jgi:DNA polymerase III subunit delta'
MFDQLTGNNRVKEVLRRMLGSGRLPGALLFVGEEGVGKKMFALELARALNCRTPQGAEGCGSCSVCKRVFEINYPTSSDRDDWIPMIWTNHRDVGMVVAPKRVLRVDQMRQIEREANFRPMEGKARVFIVDEAEKFNDASANALLKVLEEPPSTSHLILITSRPAMLLPTILSRCQMIRFAPLSPAEIEGYLKSHKLVEPKTASVRARAAAGSISRALSGDIQSFEAQRTAMLAVLDALVATEGRAQLLRSAEQLNEAQYKEEFEERLDVLETLIRDAWMVALGVESELLVNKDLLIDLQRIGKQIDPTKAAAWILEIEDLREQLIVNINKKAATDSLFLTMASGEIPLKRFSVK